MNNFKIVIEFEDAYWPFWPFRIRRWVFRSAKGFKIHLHQRDTNVLHNTNPVEISGYVSTNGDEITTSVDSNGGTRLKKKTFARGQ